MSCQGQDALGMGLTLPLFRSGSEVRAAVQFALRLACAILGSLCTYGPSRYCRSRYKSAERRRTCCTTEQRLDWSQERLAKLAALRRMKVRSAVETEMKERRLVSRMRCTQPERRRSSAARQQGSGIAAERSQRRRYPPRENQSQQRPNHGFNAATTVYEDLLKAGVIDPAKVTRVPHRCRADRGSPTALCEAILAPAPLVDGMCVKRIAHSK